MSSIPSSKMKHAHAHEGDHPEQAQHPTHQPEAQGGAAQDNGGERSGDQAPASSDGQKTSQAKQGESAKAGKLSGAKLSDRAQRLAGRAEELAEDAVGAVKARPKTAAAIGAAIVAGAAAILGGPAAARALKGDDGKKAAPKRKPAAKKEAAKKG